MNTPENRNILTVDVEDWFHICGTDRIGDIASWDRYESRIERNLLTLLDIFTKYNTKGTFFVLGWIAERLPEAIKEIDKRGHEIASHGYSHKLVYDQTPEEFAQDLKKSLEILNNITSQKVMGYRAPSFSITKNSLWALDIIAEHGLVYDSSIFPAERGDGGLPGAQNFVHELRLKNGKALLEFPASTMDILSFKVAFSGGGYFRLFPYWLIKKQIRKINNKGEAVLVYLHPREIDINQPKLNLPWNRKFKYYVNIKDTEYKLKKLLCDFKLAPIKEMIERQSQ